MHQNDSSITEQQAMCRLIERFVDRQALAAQTMQALRPDKILKASPAVPIEEIYRAHEKYSGTPTIGVIEEWHYAFHGLGCRLIHRETKEPIEWDAPDLQRFDRYWFENWVTWLLSQSNSDKDVAIIKSSMVKMQLREFIDRTFQNLEAKGDITREEPSFVKYKLIRHEAGT
jgi:hypothetical protein